MNRADFLGPRGLRHKILQKVVRGYLWNRNGKETQQRLIKKDENVKKSFESSPFDIVCAKTIESFFEKKNWFLIKEHL